MENKVKIYHFHNGRGGGVLSVIKNLIEHSQNPTIENHIIYTINKEIIPQFTPPEIKGVTSVQIFYFSANWNFWHTCKRLAELIPDGQSIFVAHDWLELGVASHMGLQNTVVQFLHGDYEYYYQLAEKHEKEIDEFVCVSPVIARKLSERLPQRKENVHNWRFPVPEIKSIRKSVSEKIRILFCVRDLNDDSKQFNLLPQIQGLLNRDKCYPKWTIIGKGKNDKEIRSLLGGDAQYFRYLNNEQVLSEMKKNDVLIHPSLLEGFPVVVVEAMKAGLVPLITDWDGATEDLVVEGETGFYVAQKDAGGYAEKIKRFIEDRALLSKAATKAKEKAEELFNPYRNTEIIESLYITASKRDKKKLPVKIYGSRLDKKWVPNWIVEKIRGS